jgi:hypothetical protein
MDKNEITSIQRKLELLTHRSQLMDANLLKYSRDLEWEYAVHMADYRYRTTYIYTLSENYRKCCEWWVEIGDSLKEYLRRNPHVEAWIRTLYFSKYDNSPNNPTYYIDV